MDDKYARNEKVFAKIKGFAPWPAKIMERSLAFKKEERYRIVFYGSHDESTVKLDQLFRYTEENKSIYGKQKSKKFVDAMAEIEADNGLEVIESVPANLSEENQEEVGKVESEGEMTIDEEPPAQPPVLMREVEKSETSEPKATKPKRPRTLTRRESLNAPPTPPAVTSTATTVNTPSTPDANLPEIVSRSGRKIKPKRFADDDLTTPILPANKTKNDEGGVPARKSKRTSSVKTAAKATGEGTLEESVSHPQTTSKAAKSKTENNRLSPDISFTSTNTTKPKRRASINKNSAPAVEPPPPLEVEKEEGEDISEENSSQSIPTLTNELDDTELDKENSLHDSLEEETDETLDGSKFDEAQDSPPSSIDEERKIRVAAKNGLNFELSFDVNNPEAKTEADNKAWQTIANQNIRKVIEDLREDGEESQDLINSIVENIPSRTHEEEQSREKLASQLKVLRLEGEVIEIIGEIVGCLGENSADCMRAIDLLDRLEEHKLNTLMLKRHPEIVQTIHKLRCYVGNVESWGFSPEQKEEFSACAEEIRRKSVSIFKHFQNLFGADTSDTFAEIYEEELNLFKEKVSDLPHKKILGLTEDNGELIELELDVDFNGEPEVDGDIEPEAEENGENNIEEEIDT